MFNEVIAALTGHTLTVSVDFKPVVVEDAGNQSAAASAPLADEQAKTKLVELLGNAKYRFRSIDKLSKAIGRSRCETEEFLVGIGSRPSRRNPNLFCLTSRVGQRQFA